MVRQMIVYACQYCGAIYDNYPEALSCEVRCKARVLHPIPRNILARMPLAKRPFNARLP